MSWKQSRSGLAIDLVQPDLSKIDLWLDVAIPLSLINRFDGHASASEWHGYSVAQHCCLGADAVLHETGGDTDAALAFLLHDAHEVFSGDITTPVAEALDQLVFDPLGPEKPRLVRGAIRAMKSRLDKALYARLGLAWPLPVHLEEIVAEMDIRMLKAERDRLMVEPPAPWGEAVESAAPVALTDADFAPRRADHWAEGWRARLVAWHPFREGEIFSDISIAGLDGGGEVAA